MTTTLPSAAHRTKNSYRATSSNRNNKLMGNNKRTII